jgi:hypothetical protein
MTGWTGTSGPTGPQGVRGLDGSPKNFTIFLNYSGGSTISSVRIPRGLFGPAAVNNLQVGGDFNSNQGTDLQFTGASPTLLLNNTANAFVIHIAISGYRANGWQPMPYVNMDPSIVRYTMTSDNSVSLYLPLSSINGGNLTLPTTGAGAGYLVTVTIFYL